jgi:hypothetical protein
MAVKHNNLYLYLALVCFLGIIIIFIFDGYMGVYDRLIMDNGQYKQTIESDQWAQQEKYGGIVSVGLDRSGQMDFTYTVANHRFSAYTDSLEVTLWLNKVKTATLLSRQLSIPAFDKEVLTWSINATQIVPASLPAEQSYNINMRIDRSNVEREVLVNIYPSSNTIKVVPPGVAIPAPAPTR